MAGIGIVFNVAGCLIRGRRRWSVTYTSPRGLRISEFLFLEFGIEGHFRREDLRVLPVSWVDENSPYYFPGRGANPRPPAHLDFITTKESHTLLAIARSIICCLDPITGPLWNQLYINRYIMGDHYSVSCLPTGP